MESLLTKAFKNEPLERPPVWMMRQAGRYLPEYRAMKEKYDFLTLCRTPELACEITMQPIRRLRPDASIIFADILLPAEALGFEIDFAPGPLVANKVSTAADVASLSAPYGVKNLTYVFDAIATVRKELDAFTADGAPIGLIGFAGAPWTMACYLCDQSVYKHFQGTQVFAAEQPMAFASLTERIADITIDYLLGQIESGAEVVQLFDSWAGNLSIEDYRRLALPATQRIIEGLRKTTSTPIILYANGSSHLLPAMLESGADGLGVDWRTDLEAARELVGEEVTLQGNLDPTHLFRSRDEIVLATRHMVGTQKSKRRFIANLGHGILQKTPVENAEAFISTVQEGWLTK